MNVIFDMDGVIFDSERAYVDLYKQFAPKYGLDDIDAVHRACMDSIGVTVEKTREIFCQAVGREFDYEAYRADVQKELTKKFYDRKPGVYEIFDWLKEIGASIALASSTRYPTVKRMLDHDDLTKYFDAIVCGNMISHSKPHPEIFLKAAQELGVEPSTCYVIEDSYNGVRAAHAAGMHALMVPDILQPDEEIRSLAEAVLPSLIDVKNYLQNVLEQR